MKIASAIVTDRGGRTSHAAIVARELGIPAIVGTGDATTTISDGATVTVSCAEGETGHVYEGAIPSRSSRSIRTTLPRPRTRIMLNVGDPDSALKLAMLPCDGVGLARMEFIFASWVGVHPLALTRYASADRGRPPPVDARTGGAADKTQYFVDRLAQGIGVLAAAFWPRPVILRFSDFKTNEYARLIGGAQFEPHEENPMLGWRGASRYYHPRLQGGLPARGGRGAPRARDLRPDEPQGHGSLLPDPSGGRTRAVGHARGRSGQGEGGLEVYVMAEIPSNILMADQFAEIFDGFSIGSNDLTQLTLGVDRDSTTVAPLFDERSDAVKQSCAQLIEAAHHGTARLASAVRRRATTRSSPRFWSSAASIPSASTRMPLHGRVRAYSPQNRPRTSRLGRTGRASHSAQPALPLCSVPWRRARALLGALALPVDPQSASGASEGPPPRSHPRPGRVDWTGDQLPEKEFPMAKINEIMSKNVVSLPFDTSIAFAAQRMRDANVGVILVTEQDPTKLYGVVTDRDLIVRGLAVGRDPKEMKLAEVCSRQLATLSPTDEVGRAEELMAEKAIRRIPVIDGERLVGILSLGDLAIKKERESTLARISAAPPNS